MIIFPNNITNINKTPLTTNNANMLEEYFQLNQHVTEPKYGKPKFDF